MKKGTHHSPESRAKMSITRTGKKLSLETRAKLSTYRGRIPWNKGKKLSLEARAKISAGQIGRLVKKETRDKIRAAHIGKIHSLETRNKLSSINKGKKWSPETRAKMMTFLLSPENREKRRIMSIGKTWHKGYKHSFETRNKISMALKGKKIQPIKYAKLCTINIRHWENDLYIAHFLAGTLFGKKSYENLSDIQKKLLKIAILKFKIRRSQHDGKTGVS